MAGFLFQNSITYVRRVVRCGQLDEEADKYVAGVHSLVVITLLVITQNLQSD